MPIGKKNAVGSILKTGGIIFCCQFFVLLWIGPLWEIDSGAYLAGGFTWSIYHSPFTNLFYALLGQVWKNAGFLVTAQMMVWALISSLFITELFESRKWQILAALICAFEPVSLYYHLNLLSESLFLSFCFLFLFALLREGRGPDSKNLILGGVAWGLMFFTRLEGVILGLPVLLSLAFSTRTIQQKIKGLLPALGPLVLAGGFLIWGKAALQHPVFARQRPLWDLALSSWYSSPPGSSLAASFTREFMPDGDIVLSAEGIRERSYKGFKKCTELYENQGLSYPESECRCDSLFGEAGRAWISRHPVQSIGNFWQDNFIALHTGNYLSYRFSPGLDFDYEDSDYQYVDSIVCGIFQARPPNVSSILWIWRKPVFLNLYFPVLFWVFFLGCLLMTIRIKKRSFSIPYLLFCGLPFVLHVLALPYRTRFLLPAVLPVLLWALSEITSRFRVEKPRPL